MVIVGGIIKLLINAIQDYAEQFLPWDLFQQPVNQGISGLTGADDEQSGVRTVHQHIGIRKDSEGRSIDDDVIEDFPYVG